MRPFQRRHFGCTISASAWTRIPPSEKAFTPLRPPSLSQLEAPAPNGSVFSPVGKGLAPPGDITADLKIAALMNTYNQNLSLRSGSGLPFVDLKGSPAVSIGHTTITGQWTWRKDSLSILIVPLEFGNVAASIDFGLPRRGQIVPLQKTMQLFLDFWIRRPEARSLPLRD